MTNDDNIPRLSFVKDSERNRDRTPDEIEQFGKTLNAGIGQALVDIGKALTGVVNPTTPPLP